MKSYLPEIICVLTVAFVGASMYIGEDHAKEHGKDSAVSSTITEFDKMVVLTLEGGTEIVYKKVPKTTLIHCHKEFHHNNHYDDPRCNQETGEIIDGK